MTDDRLVAAIAAHHAQHPPAPHVRALGSIGELAVAESLGGGLRRVVLVTGADESTRTLNIVMATNQIEAATDLDVVVDRNNSGARYDLVVEGELYGPIFSEQLDDLVGFAGVGLAQAVANALKTDGDSLAEFDVGLPLAGTEDPRRSFKESELLDLTELVSSCRQWLAGARSEITTLDPEMFIPPPVGTPIEEVFARLDELLEVLDTFEAEGHLISVDLRDRLSEVAAEDLQRWHTECGVDVWSRLLRIAHQDRFEILEADDSSDLRELDLQSRARAGFQTVDFMTSASHQWSDPILIASEPELKMSCRGRAVVGASR